GDPRIEWLGRLGDDEVASRMRGADVFCAPSLHGESFGVVLLEAMAAGAVVVASQLDGYRNVATDGLDALLTEPGDADALAAALRSALGDASLRAQLQGAGERRVQLFSMDRLAELYVERYERLVTTP
ncbi:MAG TPA: glycosyltransferase, partial [Acidimicrobiales bacterium]|nr:glycosyltransferase [Acidimicrobiales bacterium]